MTIKISNKFKRYYSYLCILPCYVSISVDIARFPPGRNIFFPAVGTLIVIRYVLKASGNLDRATNSVLGTVLSLPVTRWAYHALWPLNVTLAFNVACCVPASKPPSLFIRQISQTPGSELCGPSLLCNRSRLHCDTCQRGRKWRSDLLNYLCGNPPLSIPLPAWDQSVTQSVFAQRCMQWALATRRSERCI